MLEPLTVGIIGTGRAATRRAEALCRSRRADLIVVASRREATAHAFASRYGAEGTSDWKGLVGRPDLDAVCVSTINPLHAEMALAGLEAGKHVLVEYPMALTVADADRMVSEARQHKRVLHVGHFELLTPEHQALRERSEALGPLLLAIVVSLSPDRPPGKENWTYNRHLFGFPFLGAVSRINRLLDLYGAPTRVMAAAREIGGDSLGNFQGCVAMMTLFFAEGGIGQVIYGKGAGVIEERRSVEIQAMKGRIRVERNRLLHQERGQNREISLATRQDLFAKDTEHFLEEIRGEAHPYFTAEEAKRAVTVAAAAEQAAERGRPITLCEGDSGSRS